MARPVEHQAEQQWRNALKNARGSRELAGPQPVAGRAEHGERQRAARNCQHPISPAVQQHEREWPSARASPAARHRLDESPVASRAEIIGEVCRSIPELDETRGDLGRPDQRGRGDRGRRRRPIASSRRGRCDARAVETNHVAPNTLARTIIVHGTPDGRVRSLPRPAGGGGGAFGTSSRLIGRPIIRCNAAQARHAPRQPNASMKKALVGQPTVLAKPANRVMPVMALRASLP